ncbi:hypothetical protein ONZ45_g16023 [Pleurotus djamor]|nr:hypothetical protein ONZ45_g16023 [Pleurotus djamor]
MSSMPGQPVALPANAVQALSILWLDLQKQAALADSQGVAIAQISQTLDAIAARMQLPPRSPSPPMAEPPTPVTPPSTVRIPAPRGEKLKPANPPAFDGSRANGVHFLNSVNIWFQLRPDLFVSDQARILWTLSYFSKGRAQEYANRCFRMNTANTTTWMAFETAFKSRFFPLNERELARVKLESSTWHQHDRTFDEYLDEFQELADQADYPLGAQLTLKFRKGLRRSIQDQIAESSVLNPGDDDTIGWYTAAQTIWNNMQANTAFRAAESRMPLETVVDLPEQAPPSPPIPVAINHHEPRPIPIQCLRCSSTEHEDRDCPCQFDLQHMTKEEAERLLDKLSRSTKTNPQVKDKTKELPQRRRIPGTPSTAFNRFSCLPVEEPSVVTETNPEETNPAPTPANPDTPQESKGVPTPPKTRRPGWEKRLPKRFQVSATPSALSLDMDISVQATDTESRFHLHALLDSGASGLFIHPNYVEKCGFSTRPLSSPIPVYNVDGTMNQEGSIREVVDLVLRYKDHSERALFAVTNIGKQDIIVGYSWLKEHNPEVNWQTKEVKMSRCPRVCSTCREELKEIRRIRHRESRHLRQCRLGPTPFIDDEPVDLPALLETDDSDDPDVYEPNAGDRLFSAIPPPTPDYAVQIRSMEIRASETISQRLAIAFQKNKAVESRNADFPDLFTEFESVFAKEAFDELPQSRPWDHAIELVDGSEPANCKVYPLSPVEQRELDAFIEENLNTGRIRPSKSPMASPVFFIKKKDGSLRLVQDYRKLNSMTIKNRYPIPLISELVDKLKNARYFTKLDVRWGYNNVRIKEGDEWKAAFRTNRGLFEPLVMFFGLTNSPGTFQTMMNDLFRDLITEGVVVIYLDDILIFTESRDEHRKVLRRVLKILQDNKLYLRPEKCEFEQTKIEYLGVVVSEGKVEMDPAKIAGVAEWPEPRNQTELQSFLGFVNFYRRFMKDYSHIARPLFDIQNAKEWTWTGREQTAFEQIKGLITSEPILAAPIESRPWRLEADSSDFATGAVLSQLNPEDDKWHPVAFFSKSLSPAERNYEIHDKEMLSIIRGLEEWRHYLEGAETEFEIWTDHKNLEYFTKAQKLNRRQARWSLYLSRFDFTLHHRPGRSMGKPDALSRRADHGNGKDDNQNQVLLKPAFFAVRAVETALEGEEIGILGEIRAGLRSGTLEEPVAKAALEVKRLRGSRKAVRGSEWEEDNGLLLFRGKVYVPNTGDLRRRIVEQHHDSKVAGHPGRFKTLELVSRNYWWPNLSRYIGSYTKHCDLCLRTKPQRRMPLGELTPLEIPEERWKRISVDFIVELPQSDGYDAIMNVVDYVSKRAHFIPTHTTVSALGAANLFLQHVWKLHGLPNTVVSDRGTQFIAEFTREIYEKLGIQLAASTSYHPQTDGQTERCNQELEQYLRTYTNQRQNNWAQLLPMAEFAYNNHIHNTTQQTPFILDTGRHPRMGFEPRTSGRVEEAKEFVSRMKTAVEEAKSAIAFGIDDE